MKENSCVLLLYFRLATACRMKCMEWCIVSDLPDWSCVRLWLFVHVGCYSLFWMCGWIYWVSDYLRIVESGTQVWCPSSLFERERLGCEIEMFLINVVRYNKCIQYLLWIFGIGLKTAMLYRNKLPDESGALFDCTRALRYSSHHNRITNIKTCVPVINLDSDRD